MFLCTSIYGKPSVTAQNKIQINESILQQASSHVSPTL